jgi:hypothetical protein
MPRLDLRIDWLLIDLVYLVELLYSVDTFVSTIGPRGYG